MFFVQVTPGITECRKPQKNILLNKIMFINDTSVVFVRISKKKVFRFVYLFLCGLALLDGEDKRIGAHPN